jgi:murein DD-endopeptidase MepM/ murein hydrolase activator NlpD
MLTMTTSPFRRATVVASVFLLVSSMGPAAMSQVSEDDVEEARREQEQAEAIAEEAASERAAAIEDLDAAVEAYEAVRGELEALTFSVGRLRARIDAYEDDTLELREVLKERAVQSYMNGDERDPVARVFSPERVQQSIIAREVLALAVESDAEQLDDLAATTAEMERLRTELDVEEDRLRELQAESSALLDRMNELYEEANLVFEAASADAEAANQEFEQVSAALAEQRRREEEARLARERLQAELKLPAEGVPEWVTPGFVCPVGGVSWFRDTWGAPRSGGRAHKGVDMMGPRYTPLVAVGDGIIRKSYGSLGGNIVWLYADHGVNYFYAHLDSYPNGLADGQWVPRGTVIGYMGDTGNPAPGAYHLHFGIYPGGITAVNPYPSVARVCP